MKKIMISVAPVSAADTDIDPRRIADDVLACREAGASMVHLHVRDPHGKLTPDMTLLEETVRYIRADSDIVVEISTGGVSDLTIEERCQPCFAPYVEATSLNVGSVNLDTAVYQNPIADVKTCVRTILENGKRPEIEVFELGMIHTVKELDAEFGFVKPVLFALVFGHGGEMPATPSALEHMVSYLEELFPDGQALWGYTEAFRRDWDMVSQALERGASSVRIGFEDSDFLSPAEQVKTNAPLVERAAALIREKGMEPMTPEEVRTMMQIAPLR